MSASRLQAVRKLHAPTLDQSSGIRIVEQALEEQLRRIVSNAGTSHPCMIANAPKPQGRSELGVGACEPVM